MRAAGLAYAVLGFAITHLVFAALIAFLLGIVPYPNIDGGPAMPLSAAIPIDLALIALFGLQHTGMARRTIKAISARLLPALLERATYVHAANFALALLVLAWRPIPIPLLDVEPLPARIAIWTVFALGWGLAAFGSLLIDHLQLLGLSQAWAWFRGRAYEIKPFQRHWLYQRLRHPIQFGLILAFWATPHLTVGHAILAAGLTAYILVGTHFEERDLLADFPDYAAYRTKVPGLFPRLWR